MVAVLTDCDLAIGTGSKGAVNGVIFVELLACMPEIALSVRLAVSCTLTCGVAIH